jgi:acyl-coenzyme A synthetase/AMP-(fatty) acid ligase
MFVLFHVFDEGSVVLTIVGDHPLIYFRDESTICPEFDGVIDDTALMLFSSGTTGNDL